MGSDVQHKIERAEKTLERLLQWIRSADSRVRLVLPLSTAMLGALALLIPASDKWQVLAGISTFSATGFLGLAIIFTGLASFPRTKGSLGSLVYFGGIISKDLEHYSDEFQAQDDNAYLRDLLRQCHRNAQVADKKFLWVQRSIFCLFGGTVPWLISIAALYTQQ